MIESIENTNLIDNFNYFEENFHSIENSRILISGASGFVGNWISELLFQISSEFDLKFEVVMLTRDAASFRKKFSDSKSDAFSIFEADLSKEKINFGSFSHVVHAATPTFTSGNVSGQATRASLNGARNLIDSLPESSTMPIFINLSSGAVYGDNLLGSGPIKLSAETKRPQSCEKFSDEYRAAKIDTELLIDRETIAGKIIGCNPRLFAFFGPLLPVDQKYAIGNFMLSAINKRSLNLKSSGESVRSYLHASDLASQIIYLLSNPIIGPSHIGSNMSMSLIEWAEYVSEMFNCGPVVKGNFVEAHTYYVPEVDDRIPSLNSDANRRNGLFRDWFDWLKVRS